MVAAYMSLFWVKHSWGARCIRNEGRRREPLAAIVPGCIGMVIGKAHCAWHEDFG